MSNAPSRPGLRPPTRPAWHGPPDALRVVWTRPRATVRWILDHGDLRLSILLICAVAATAVVADGALPGRASSLGVWAWVVAMSVGMLIALGAWAMAALALLYIGRALGGVGRWRELLVAIAWGQAPAAAGMPFALLKAWSQSLDRPDSELLAALCLFLLWGWSLVITTLAVAEAHRFSFARAVVCAFALLGLYVALGAGLHAAFGLDLGV
ncbi:MAG: YIP1 family protein [Candidatus Eisenbacteria bacterium]